MKRIVLHIDSLVLKGFRYEDRQSIAEGLQQELTRLLADPQVSQRWTANGNLSLLRIGSIPVRQNSKPQHVGSQVAKRIDKRMKI